MEFKSLMHVSFFTDQMDVMRDFYENKLGLKVKIVTRAGLYKGLNRGKYSEVAEVDPNRIIIVYIEIAPGQFIELFPKDEGQAPHDESEDNDMDKNGSYIRRERYSGKCQRSYAFGKNTMPFMQRPEIQ